MIKAEKHFFKKLWKLISKLPMAWIAVTPHPHAAGSHVSQFLLKEESPKGRIFPFLNQREACFVLEACLSSLSVCTCIYIGKGSREIFGQRWGGVSKASVPAFVWVGAMDRRINRSFHALKKVTEWVFDSDSSLTFAGWKLIGSFTGTWRCGKHSFLRCRWRSVFVRCVSSGMFSTGANLLLFFSILFQHCFIHWYSKITCSYMMTHCISAHHYSGRGAV